MIKLATVSLTNEDDKNYPFIQVKYLGGKVGNALNITPYGLYSNPTLNSSSLLFSLQGNEAKLAAITNDFKNRVKNLKSGEVVLANLTNDLSIKLLNSEEIIIKAKTITIEAENAVINSDSTDINSTTVNLGNNATLGVARLNDLVQVDTNTGAGTITSASTSISAS